MPRPIPILLAALALAAILAARTPLALAAAPAAAQLPARPAALPTIAPLPTLAPDPKVIRATIDAAMLDHITKLSAFEAEYKAHRAGYFQTLLSHTAVPADGALAAPDKLAAGPTDQPEKLNDFWGGAQLAAQLPYAFRTDVYDGPEGAGFVLTVQVVLAGELWEQSVNTGPERWRDAAWHVVEPER